MRPTIWFVTVGILLALAVVVFVAWPGNAAADPKAKKRLDLIAIARRFRYYHEMNGTLPNALCIVGVDGAGLRPSPPGRVWSADGTGFLPSMERGQIVRIRPTRS